MVFWSSIMHPNTDAGPSTPAAPELYGLLAEFHDPQTLVEAAAALRKAGYKRWDCYTPFPVHKLDEVMGVKPTILPWVVFGAAFSAVIGAFGLAWFCNAFDYPLNLSGKPYWGLPAHITVAFPAMVLTGVVTSFVTLWILAGLPRYHHPLFTVERFRRATDDGFFIAVEATDPCFSPKNTAELFRDLGAIAVEEVRD